MKRKGWPLIFAALLPLSLFAVAGMTTRQGQNPGPPPSVIQQPSDWVAFEADFLQTQPGVPDITGRYFRGSDASFRVEQHAIDGTLDTIWISNVPRAISYTYHSAIRKWMSTPLSVPPGGRMKILQRRVGMPGLTHLEARIEGFALHEYRDLNGNVEQQAPALNFFALVSESSTHGVRRVFSNIQQREPARSLFELPEGVVAELMKDRRKAQQ